MQANSNLNFIIATGALIGLNKPGWEFYDRVDEGIRRTHLETDLVSMRMDKLNEKMEEMGQVIAKYPAMANVFGENGHLQALLKPNGACIARLYLHIEKPFMDIALILGRAMYNIDNSSLNQAGDVIPVDRTPVIPNSSVGGVQSKSAPNVPGATIQARSQGRVVTDGVGVAKRKQYPVIHPRTKGQDGDDDYYPSEAERKRRAMEQQGEQMEEEEEEEEDREENGDGNISSDGEISNLRQGTQITQQNLPGYPQYQTIDLGGGNYATAPNQSSAFQQSYFGQHKDQRYSEQEYQQVLNSDINQNDI